MSKKLFRYKKNSTPGKGGTRFKIALNTEELEPLWIITNDIENGFCLYIDEKEGNIYTVRLITAEPKAFMPPELLKCGTEYTVVWNATFPGRKDLGTIKIL